MGTDENGEPSKYRQSHYLKWAFLKNSPFIISSKCCEVMKEKPLNEYRKQCGKRPIIGTMASESKRRLEAWLQTGCNAFDSKKQVSKPLSFWTEQDVLRYLRDFNISYASVYGDIITDKNGKLCTTGENRTGCIFCPVGCHLDKENRFQRLKSTHPELYDYCINVLGLGAFLDYIGVNYS
jgi:3'-phosphoadenosine 5'-phosphosulfate sulfotransferase (PAPS reductase)/FAD synthetase